MTTVPATPDAAGHLSGKSYFLLRRLHSLTGIIFGGYLVVHLLVNATIAQMGSVYQVQVKKIHDLPLLIAVEWTFIFIPILYHIVYGIWITLAGRPNVDHYPYQKNWLYLLQRISAIIIVLFLFFHVFSLKYGLFGAGLAFDETRAAFSVHQHMTRHLWLAWLIYPIGILASCFHLANGFWAAAITWGLTVSKGAQRRWGYVCVVLFAATLLFGMTAFIASLNPKLANLDKAGNVEVRGS